MKIYNGADVMNAEKTARSEGAKVRHKKTAYFNDNTLIFFGDGSMDYYKYDKAKHGFTKRHYTKTPNKYLVYKY